MNNVNVIGRLTKDVEVKYVGANQTAMARITVAVDRYTQKEKTTDFIPVVIFGNQAENAEKFLGKGSKVGVTGSLKSGSYEKSDGTRVYTLDVNAFNVEYLDDKKSEGGAKQMDIESQYEALDEELPF